MVGDSFGNWMTAQVAIENLMVNVACKVLYNIETTCFNLNGYCHVGDNILFCVCEKGLVV